MDLSCPVVPWTEMEASALRSELFVCLLFRIGLFPAQTVLYPRIPCEWSPDTLYSVALLFGPVEQKRIDFNLTLVKKIELYFPNWEEQSSSCCCYAIREGVSFSEDSYLKCGEEIPRKNASSPHSPWQLYRYKFIHNTKKKIAFVMTFVYHQQSQHYQFAGSPQNGFE